MVTRMNMKIIVSCSEKTTLILVILFVISAHVYRSYAAKWKQERAIYSKDRPGVHQVVALHG